MEKILEQLSQVLQEARALVNEYKSRITALETREAALVDGQKEHSENIKSLAEREALITPIENIRAAEKALDERAQKLEEQSVAFLEKKEELKTHFDAIRQSLDTRAKDLDEIEKNTIDRAKKIDAEVQKQVDAFVSKFKNSAS